MSSIEEAVRRRAYEAWEQAGEPEGAKRGILVRGDRRIGGTPPTLGERVEASWSADRRAAELAVRHGVPVGMPGERIVEQGVDDEGLENLLLPHSPGKVEDLRLGFALCSRLN